MRRWIFLALVCALPLTAPAIGRAAGLAVSEVQRGHKVFDTRCVFCHGEGLGHPAWQLLALKKGKDKAEIVGRSDLTPDYIKHVVRNGFIEMPPFRASELSDPDLDALADYIVHTGAASAARP